MKQGATEILLRPDELHFSANPSQIKGMRTAFARHRIATPPARRRFSGMNP